MTDLPQSISPVTETPMSLIDKRLADLREANDVFRTHSWDRSSAIARNEREISWLRDLRSALVLCGHAQKPKEPCVHDVIIGLDGLWHCQTCAASVDVAVAHSSTIGNSK